MVKKRVILTKKQKEFLNFLEKALGIVTTACERFKINRGTYYLWLENPRFKKEVELIHERLKDFGETAFIDLLKQRNPQAVIHFNKTKNKDRGYGENMQTEVTHKGTPGENIIVEIVEGKYAKKGGDNDSLQNDRQGVS